MKKLFIIANWKSNKTGVEAIEWLQEIKNSKSKIQSSKEKEIIICPPFVLLPIMKSFIEDKNLLFKLGGQDISPFGTGAYTGEINAQQIKEFADYVIIGHSERRNNFNETDDLLTKKVEMAKKFGLTPIYCIQNENTFIPADATLVAYEPPTAIGTGKPDTPENAEQVAKTVKDKYPQVAYILYGGSVIQDNINSFVKLKHINGVLVGGASLNSHKFSALIRNASI